ncbi:hypothetical protein AB0R12_00280 [Streptomyces niveus]|uniref:hypothetical protein n=1 Tax=Streptomyces niveus TaxID=193462 RepID=UPI00342859DB
MVSSQTDGLTVTVQGGLPDEVMKSLSDAVRQAVLARVAELDLAPPLREVSTPDVLDSLSAPAAGEEGFPGLIPPFRLGIVLTPEEPE